MPVWLTNILSTGYFVFLPVIPILKVFGLSNGEYLNGPSILGISVGLAFYSSFLFLIGKIIQKVMRRKA